MLLFRIGKYLRRCYTSLQNLTDIRGVRKELRAALLRITQSEAKTMALQDDLNKLQSDIAAYKQRQADAQAAEDTLEQGQASTLTDLTTRIVALETTGSPQVAELASQVEQVVKIVNQLVTQTPTEPAPVPLPNPTDDTLTRRNR